MLRVYEHNGMLHMRDGIHETIVPIEPHMIAQTRRDLRQMEEEGKLQFITLRTILEN